MPVGATQIVTATSSALCLTYSMRWVLPNGITVDGTAIEAPLADSSFQVLIGRDVLKHCILLYIGPENQFTVSI